MNDIYDILVIGAGPAGATFARRAATDGKRILLVDGQSPTAPKPCGGLLSPDAQRVLARFDFVLPRSVLADPQIFSVKTMDLASQRVRYYQRYYLNMNRYAFDKWLLSLVPPSVDCILGRCLEVRRQDGVFCADILVGGKLQTFRGRLLVGADGANSVVRKRFFNRPIMKYVSIQQWFPRGTESNPFYSCVFDPETSESCSWMMYKDDAVIFGGCFTPKGCRLAFEQQKKRLSAFLGQDLGEPFRTEACLADRPRRMRDFVTGKDGVYLIGEAAGFISASSFEGISSAIISGDALAAAMKSGGTHNQITRAYRRGTAKLHFKLWLKIKKRWFMYTPIIRRLIMASGLASIDVEDRRDNEKQ